MPTYNLSIIQLRATAAQFTASNPTPLSGQLCVETDSAVRKAGDGVTRYNDLDAFTLDGEEQQSADAVWAYSQMPAAAGKVLKVALSHDGETAELPPINTVLRNTLGVASHAWGKTDPGTYFYSMNGFDIDKVSAAISNPYVFYDSENHYAITVGKLGAGTTWNLTLTVTKVQDGTTVDDILGAVMNVLTIEVED